ncbi:MAG: glycosyltransferase family 2 protein [Candidatus Falkowbacteria bacterium]
MNISFIILNYKTKGLVKNCIRSILESDMAGLRYEIIVVDNDSEDGIKEMLQENFSNVKFIQNNKNSGMGAGNNLGISYAQGKYLAILNPDTMAVKDAFKKMVEFLDNNEKVGLVGPRLVSPNSNLQYTRCRFPKFLTPVYRRTPLQKLPPIRKKLDEYLTKDQNYNTASKTDWLYGACLIVRKSVIAKIGNFDQRFFLGFEDTDLCQRIWQSGHEVWYYPTSVLIHYPHRFSGSGNWLTSMFSKNVRIHIMSWLKYFWKYRTAS